eukprot:284816814_6
MPCCQSSVSEWLRRWTRNLLGSPCVGSNPAAIVRYPVYFLSFYLFSSCRVAKAACPSGGDGLEIRWGFPCSFEPFYLFSSCLDAKAACPSGRDGLEIHWGLPAVRILPLSSIQYVFFRFICFRHAGLPRQRVRVVEEIDKSVGVSRVVSNRFICFRHALMPRQRVRVVKEMDKSIGVSPRRFESCRCRDRSSIFFSVVSAFVMPGCQGSVSEWLRRWTEIHWGLPAVRILLLSSIQYVFFRFICFRHAGLPRQRVRVVEEMDKSVGVSRVVSNRFICFRHALMPRQRVRVVKEMGKSIGVSPRRFESCRCRDRSSMFFFVLSVFVMPGCQGSVSEWLRRWTRSPLGFPAFRTVLSVFVMPCCQGSVSELRRTRNPLGFPAFPILPLSSIQYIFFRFICFRHARLARQRFRVVKEVDRNPLGSSCVGSNPAAIVRYPVYFFSFYLFSSCRVAKAACPSGGDRLEIRWGFPRSFEPFYLFSSCFDAKAACPSGGDGLEIHWGFPPVGSNPAAVVIDPVYFFPFYLFSSCLVAKAACPSGGDGQKSIGISLRRFESCRYREIFSIFFFVLSVFVMPGCQGSVSEWLRRWTRNPLGFPAFRTVLSVFVMPNCQSSVSEWLKRWTRNPLGSPRVGSNSAAVVIGPVYFFFVLSVFVMPGCQGSVSEWLRRWTRNPLGFPAFRTVLSVFVMPNCQGSVSEWLRRWTRNPLGFPAFRTVLSVFGMTKTDKTKKKYTGSITTAA